MDKPAVAGQRTCVEHGVNYWIVCELCGLQRLADMRRRHLMDADIDIDEDNRYIVQPDYNDVWCIIDRVTGMKEAAYKSRSEADAAADKLNNKAPAIATAD